MNRLILFAHFDAGDRINPHTLRHLAALKALGGRIRFLSNSAPGPEELARLEGRVDDILVRENRGMDFGMWKAGLEGLDLEPYDELLLTNSSVIGPCLPLAPIFQRMAASDCDFWGLTESEEGCRHLQSYFLVFRRTALAAPAFAQFWASVLPYRAKQNVIFSYEMGLSVFLQEQGLRAAVAFPLTAGDNGLFWNLLLRCRLSRSIRRGRNPTLFYPDALVRAGMPFVKVSLLHGKGLRLRLLRGLFRRAGQILD
jgi:rhamnosyltransferase